MLLTMKAFGSQIIAEFVNCSAPVLHHQQDLENLLATGIERYGLELKSMNSYQFEPAGVTAIAIIGASHVALHTYPEARHLSLDIFTCIPGAEGPMQLMQFLREALQPEVVRHKVLSRGRSVDVQHKDYFTDLTQSGFNIRYQVERELLNCRTDYQHLVIIENQTFGRMLFLDHQLQIATADAAIYNEALIAPLRSIHPQRLLILGGGDGGVLNALLSPAHDPVNAPPRLKDLQAVSLVDIDAQVIEAARTHLPELCGQAFEDPRAKVVVEEASSYLATQQGLDGIIYDLTMEPEVVAHGVDDGEAYFETLFAQMAHALRPGGMISLQVASHFDTRALERAKQLLHKHFQRVHFETVFIPSFCEGWVFAHGQKGD